MRTLVVFSPKCRHSSAAILVSLLVALGLCGPAFAQDGTSLPTARPPLITAAVDESQLTTLRGNTHPLARPEFDLGTASADLPLRRMLLVLKRSPAQEWALRTLLDDQQDKRSPSYHKWLTPDEFGRQFGPTDTDMQTITAWLQSHGFQVGTTKGRTVLEFSGTAGQVQETFHTTIHKYLVNSEQHWANANDPSIPTALTPAVAGVLTLHNFIKKPTIHFTGEKVAAKLVHGKGGRPQVTFPPQNGQPAINALGPEDYAVIYNINPIYDVGINGGGISIAVVGRSDLFNGGQDIQNFHDVFGLNGGPFNITLDGPDPGDLGGGEEAEATLDMTWSGAIAPIAGLNFVVSATTNTTDGVDLSENYIIEKDLAAIMTESFSACELYATDADLAGHGAMAEQAAAEGITYFVAAGDNGAEGCDDPSVAPATHPISVNYLASTAYDIAVGGTMFNENGNTGKYWTSAAPFAETAISYIPEDVWNESSLTNGLWAGSGGASAGNIASGVGTTPGVPKPNWQYGVAGIPDDGVRDLPDVSLTAAEHDPYLLCLEGSCVPNDQGEVYVYFVSGTSASTPSFAGIMALVDQKFADVVNDSAVRMGPANYILYRLAATESAYPSQCNGSNTSTLPASTCIFNDITVGNNVVPGEVGSDYQAGVGYDQTTGLGSVNVTNLVNNWNSVTFNPTTTTLSMAAATITHGTPVPFSITVTPNSGNGTPTGDVFMIAYSNSAAGDSSLGYWTLSGGSVSSQAPDIPGGSYLMTAYYAGDETYAPSSSASTNWFTINPEPSTTTVSVVTANSNGQSVPFTSGPFGSFVYVRADVAGQSGYGVPTGTVTFSDTFGPIPSGSTFTLNSEGNTANPNGVFNFDAGRHTISASYSGDPSFNPSSTTQAQTFTISAGFFATIPSAQQTVVVTAPGATGASSLSVSNSTGFSGTISFACSGLPSESTCTFSPSTVSANGTYNATTVGITVTTTAPTTKAQADRRTGQSMPWVLGVGLILPAMFFGGRKQRALLILIMLAGLMVLPGCGGGGGNGGGGGGGGGNPGTPKGTSIVTVTATSGTTTSQTGFALIVE